LTDLPADRMRPHRRRPTVANIAAKEQRVVSATTPITTPTTTTARPPVAAKRAASPLRAPGPADAARTGDGDGAHLPGADAVYAQARHENFPVASRLLPRAIREDLMAVYGFARLTDDIGDEVAGDRGAALAWLESELDRAADGDATHPVMRRLGETIAERHLSKQPFRDLIEANRRDQVVSRYETFDDLVGYCRLSANPVGRLVLEILGAATPARVALSDDVCTGLQVVEHLQDVGEDWEQDRVYLPLADLRREGCSLTDLGGPAASGALRNVVAKEAARARRLLWSGAPLAASLPWRHRIAVAAFAAGGMAALDDIAGAGHDVLANRCRPRPGRLVARLLLLLLWHPSVPGAHALRSPSGLPAAGGTAGPDPVDRRRALGVVAGGTGVPTTGSDA
jgi:squalene synthase HpnC